MIAEELVLLCGSLERKDFSRGDAEFTEWFLRPSASPRETVLSTITRRIRRRGYDLSMIGNVPDSYKHYPKRITPGDDLIAGGAYLKWYDIRRAEAVIGGDVQPDARAFLPAEIDAGHLNLQGEL